MKKILSALLVLLLIGVVPVFAEEPQQTFDIPMQVNPLYADVIGIADLPEVLYTGETLLADPVYGTVDEVAAIVRENMKARAEHFTVYVRTEQPTGDNSEMELPADIEMQNFVTNLFNEILDEAMAHTGKPGEGDNLMWQYGSTGAHDIQARRY